MQNLILLKYFIYDRYLHLFSVNFFYKQANYLSKCQRGVLFIILSKKRFDQIFVLATKFFINRSKHVATSAYLLLLQYIIISNSEVEISSTESQSHCIQQVAHLVLISFEQVRSFQKVKHIFNLRPLSLLVISLDFEQACSLQKGKRFSFQALAIIPTAG